MSSVEHLPPIETKAKPRWQRYLLETLLAFAGAMLVTGIIYTFHLYPRIPNISIVYLLVVMALASTRGRIWAENCEGGGAVFSVALPASKMEGIPT